MNTFLAVLAITTILAAVSGSNADDSDQHTYVSNWSTRQMRATTTYQNVFRDGSNFNQRLIDPQTYQGDEYTYFAGKITIEIWLEGSTTHGWVTVQNDRSIVAYDSTIPGSPGVDIFLSKLGTLIQIDEKNPEKLTTIFQW